MEKLDASGIRKAAAGFEPLSRCDVRTVALSSVSIKYKRAEIIRMRRPVACHINIKQDLRFTRWSELTLWSSGLGHRVV